MYIVIARTIILYGVVIFIIRLMGKRQVGELQPFELAVTIMVSALAAIPMEDIGIPLTFSLIPILFIFSFQVILSVLTMRSTKARAVICGKPSIVIENGKIVESELKRLRININDLLEQVRLKGYKSIDEVEYALMETNGKLSVLPKSQKRPVTPEDLQLNTSYEGIPQPLIIDGQIQNENLHKVNLDQGWLLETLKKFKINDPARIFFAAIDTAGKFIFQEKVKE